ncbi:MAG: class I adenylate-forming enzyme family protein [Burkholderiaceae bacterium]
MLTGDMLRRSAQRFPNKTAIACEGSDLSYRQLHLRANQLANKLLSLSLPAQATVAILSRNLVPYGIAFFGVARSGRVLTNVSVLYAAAELQFVLSKADVQVLIYDHAFAEKVQAVRASLPAVTSFVEIGGVGDHPQVSRFDDWIADASEAAPDIALSDTDPFCMTYTGGTTGRPKGVLCSHRARAITAHTVMVEEAIDETDTVGIVTPMFHVAALNIMFQPAVLAGATTTLLPKWSPEAFIEMVERTAMTACFMVPTQAAMLLNSPAFDAQRLSTWQKLSFAGAPMPDWVQHGLRERLPKLKLTQIYGQSEMGVIAVLRDWYLPDKLGAVGRQPYNVDVRVVRPDGTDVDIGEIGEVVSKGENLMLRYYGEPEQTDAFFKLGDGWGWSGDVATIDEEGFITLIDRSKDMMICGGENVYPKEIESVIYELSAVAECAVFGVPDDKWGEIPLAYVSLQPGQALTEESVIGHCVQRLARFKRPRQVNFVSDFPKTPIGKIQKTVLRDRYWQEQEKRI